MRAVSTLKREIDSEIKRIWLDEPFELKKIRRGFIDSGAGSYGQYFTTLVFMDGEVRALGYIVFTGILKAIDDPAFDMSHIRNMSRMLVPVCAEFLGYCGLNKLWGFSRRFLALVDQVESRDELRGLVRSLVLYVNRMHGWIHFYFPWGLGSPLRLKTREEIGEMRKLISERKGG
jgi:hypothetical protein